MKSSVITIIFCVLISVILTFTGCSNTVSHKFTLTATPSPSPLQIQKTDVDSLSQKHSAVISKSALKCSKTDYVVAGEKYIALLNNGANGYRDASLLSPCFSTLQSTLRILTPLKTNKNIFTNATEIQLETGDTEYYVKIDDLSCLSPEQFIDYAFDNLGGAKVSYELDGQRYEHTSVRITKTFLKENGEYIIEIQSGKQGNGFYYFDAKDNFIAHFVSADNGHQETRYWFATELNHDGVTDFIVLSCDKIKDLNSFWEKCQTGRMPVIRSAELYKQLLSREDFIKNFQSKEDKSVVTYVSSFSQGIYLTYKSIETETDVLAQKDYIPVHYETLNYYDKAFFD